MHAIVHREVALPKLPSASGAELVGDALYVIGDDSPWLYRLDAATLAAGQPTALFETAHFSAGRIPKHLKPDLECLTILRTTRGETGLLALGSGATAAREQGYWVPLSGPDNLPGTVYPLSMTGLYAALRPQLPAGATLNLEAAAATETELLLLQRTVGAAVGGNLLFRLPLAATLDFLHRRQPRPPAVQALRFRLPTIEGKSAGFSGAAWFAGQLFVTASVEDTADAVLDGVVLGSFVGVLPLDGTRARLAQLAWPDGRPYQGKVESVAVRQQLAPGHFELLLVTDDDAGGSTAVVAELVF
ncbi:hypothetical protein D0N36_18115 [Hymenobacter lapidiphilus]|uniref:DUF6929 family protein n=1 Tax=Hymenobacter sp. CCM 8763 TaxID=2303334 RepID=UPI000E3412FB|nr:hypothetical protein [Hymenobacter sp. CCM 8763]RFP63668.1 hypothetical protein D0N36_18115 [Hymenobacter sp. CCM 8763]